jgi:hypothetical protein
MIENLNKSGGFEKHIRSKICTTDFTLLFPYKSKTAEKNWKTTKSRNLKQFRVK